MEIARRIRDAAETGVSFDQSAILLRSPERYQPLVLEALRRAGIPAYCTRGVQRPDIAGRAFLALLRCAAEDLSATRFSEYLSLEQMPGEDYAPASAWERLLNQASVIRGIERWKTRLPALGQELARRYSTEPDHARDHLRRKLAHLESFTAFALPLIGTLDALPKQATWGDWITALEALATSALKSPERVHALLQQLEPMSEIGPATLADILLLLEERLNSLREPPTETRYGRVFVGGIEEARGLAFHSVFLPGVNEGMFPRPPAEDPLLLRSQRESLGIELRTDDSTLLNIAIAAAGKRLTLSYSRLDLLTGRSRVPSFYAFAVHAAAGGPELNVREFEEHALAATRTRIGWPAPPDPQNAIDDAEFDLATLGPRQQGAGEYLKRLPGRSVASLRTRWYRWHKPWKPADGLIIEEIGNDDLGRYRPTLRAFSPSTLQQYARCPYRFALRAIHQLRPLDRPGALQRLDPATRGDLYHRIQFELLRRLKADRLLPLTQDTLAAALESLELVLEEVAHQAQLDLAPAIPAIWNSEIRSLRADLRGWLQHRVETAPDWTPEFFELSFGLPGHDGHDAASTAAPVELPGGYLLAGSIDLVERGPNGLLRIVDHKTGKLPTPRPEILGGGEALQPLLYALAAEALLSQTVTSGRLYYATIAQNYRHVEVLLDAGHRRLIDRFFHTLDTALRTNFLPAAPRKDGCKGCDYLPICGPYEEERVQSKSQPELQELKQLRSIR